MKKALAEGLPAEIAEILGPPSILSTEDEAIYYDAMARFARDISPKDLITWFLVQDLVYARMDVRRCCGMKTGHIKHQYETALATRIHFEREQTETLRIQEIGHNRDRMIKTAKAQTAQDPADTKKIIDDIERWYGSAVRAKRSESEALIKSWQVSVPRDEQFGTAWASWFNGHQSIDEIQVAAEKRFYTALRELERHLTGFAKTLQQELKIIEGQVLKELKPETVAA